MKTVKEVSTLTGVSIRTLHYYDTIGLLKPTTTTKADYRLYDDEALARLQSILFFRELKFTLAEIKNIIDHKDYDPEKALNQQIDMLILQREHIDNLIEYAREIKEIGVKNMDFKAFDTKKMEQYAKEAKASWGDTAAYKEYEERSKDMSNTHKSMINEGLMDIFGEFGKISKEDPKGEQAQSLVAKLQGYISDNFYTCTNEILKGLGCMYAAEGEMKTNIDARGGEGTADFASKAIEAYCQ